MRLVDPGSGDAERFIRRMSAMLDELRENAPFRVAGLASPDLGPGILAESSNSSSRGWEMISLAYGEATAADGPIVRVATVSNHAAEDHSRELAGLLADERDRLFDHAGIDEPDPKEPPKETSEQIAISGSSYPAQLAATGPLWAARMQLDSVLLYLTARGVPFEDIRLEWIDDLGPLLDRRDEWIRSIVGRGGFPSDQTIPPVPTGEPALRGIIEHGLDGVRARLAPPGGSRQPRVSGRWRHELWKAAARHQAAMWDQSEHQADEQVTAVVNHLTALARAVEWFLDDPHLGDAVVDEAVAYTSRGESVASVAAHRAWLRYWSERPETPSLMEFADDPARLADEAQNVRARAETGQERRNEWLAEWKKWLSQRRGDQ